MCTWETSVETYNTLTISLPSLPSPPLHSPPSPPLPSPPLPSVDQFEQATRYASTHLEVMPSDEVMASNLHWYRLNLDLPEENYRPLQVGWAGQVGGASGWSGQSEYHSYTA